MRGWRRGEHVRVWATLVPGPDQRLGRMEQGMLRVMTGTGRSLLVDLLLDVVQRGLQIERSEQLPAQQVGVVPAHLGGQGQAVGQQHGIGWLVEPAAQGRFLVQALLLDQRVLLAGDAQHLRQLFAFVHQQAVPLGHPLGQPPVLGHGLAQLHDAHAEQFLLDLAGVLPLVDNAQLPGVEQLGVGQGQWP